LQALATPMHMGSSRLVRWTLLAGMTMRPRATSARTSSTSRASRAATKRISSVMVRWRAASSCVIGKLPRLRVVHLVVGRDRNGHDGRGGVKAGDGVQGRGKVRFPARHYPDRSQGLLSDRGRPGPEAGARAPDADTPSDTCGGFYDCAA